MAFELKRIRKSFGVLPVLDDVSLSLREGSITVILGPSGCGKTTLLNVMAGLALPDSGERRGFNGIRFSYAFQEPRLLSWLSARENAAFALSGALPREEALLRIDRFLEARPGPDRLVADRQAELFHLAAQGGADRFALRGIGWNRRHAQAGA